MDNKSNTKVGNKGNLISMKECSGDESFTREQLLKKLKALTKLLKKREGDDISQGTHSVCVGENREDTWKRMVESRKTI